LAAVAVAVGMWVGAAFRAVAGRGRAGTKAVVFERVPAKGGVIVKKRVGLCRDEGGVFALLLVCPHLGCTPRVEEGFWQCPCHGSRFDFTGRRMHGPAPRGLTHLRVRRGAEGLIVELEREVPGAWRLKL